MKQIRIKILESIQTVGGGQSPNTSKRVITTEQKNISMTSSSGDSEGNFKKTMHTKAVTANLI